MYLADGALKIELYINVSTTADFQTSSMCALLTDDDRFMFIGMHRLECNEILHGQYIKLKLSAENFVQLRFHEIKVITQPGK